VGVHQRDQEVTGPQPPAPMPRVQRPPEPDELLTSRDEKGGAEDGDENQSNVSELGLFSP
jgi:hypothetical protein